jgi:hypothetical protein
MLPFSQYIRFTFAGATFLLAGAAVAWALFPPYRVYLSGFVVGLFVSMLNGLITVQKTVKTTDYALGRTARPKGTGQLQRFLLAGFAGYTAFKYPAFFHWAGVLVGLTTVTILSLAIALTHYLWQRYFIGKG